MSDSSGPGATESVEATGAAIGGDSGKSLERQIRAFHWIRLLSELTGRHAGTDQEGEAARRVETWLRDLGLEEVSLASVASRPRSGSVLAVHAGIAALGCAVGGVLGFALALLALVAFRREMRGEESWLLRWAPARDSVNVVGRVGARKPRRRVVLLASLDAGQASPLFAGRLRGWLSGEDAEGTPRGGLALPTRALGIAAVVTAANALGADGALAQAVRIAAGVALAGLALLGVRWARDASSSGANDDASGVAAMLTAVEQLAAQLPPDAELWCAAAGAGQARGQGVRALLAAHPEWRGEHTAFVSFDCVGGGALHWARSDGDLVRAAHPPLLGELARRIAASGAYGDVSPFDLAFETAGHPVARRGGHVLALTGLQPDRLPLHWRSAGDAPRDLDTETVIRAADFGCCVLSAYLRGDAEPLVYV